MARLFSGIQPSGSLHIGNYLGAVSRWAQTQRDNDAIYCIVDLHALTLEIDPEDLRTRTYDTAAGLMACGLDPSVILLFVQSHVAAHAELSWLLECTTAYGELQRMTQFKDKGADQKFVRVSLFTYPVLMAADILLYGTDKVPVGDDQRQHLELARNIATRFNQRYGEVFVVPEADIPVVGARIMDLQHPERKMSKSVSSPLGTISIDDTDDQILRKIRRAVTDTLNEVVYDPAARPGVSNLLEILSATEDTPPATLAKSFSTYGELKEAVATRLAETLRPVREQLEALRGDRRGLEAVLSSGAERARAIADSTLQRARQAMGLTGTSA